MTLDKFTIKAQEAVQAAVNTAQMNGQQVIEPVHILKGVFCPRCRADSLISLMILIMYSYVHKRPPRNGVTNSWRVNLYCWHFSPSVPPLPAS